MFIAHLIGGGISGIVVGSIIHSWGYPLWLSILGYGLSGACITLLSALTWFLLSELGGERKVDQRHYGPSRAEA